MYIIYCGLFYHKGFHLFRKLLPYTNLIEEQVQVFVKRIVTEIEYL